MFEFNPLVWDVSAWPAVKIIVILFGKGLNLDEKSLYLGLISLFGMRLCGLLLRVAGLIWLH